MLKQNLATLHGALLGGIIVLTTLASTLPIIPHGIGLGDGAFILLILLVLLYFFKTAFYGSKTRREKQLQ